MQSLEFKRNPFLGLNRLKWGSIHPKRPTDSGRQIMLVEPFYPDLSLALSQQPCSPQAAFMNVMSLWKLLKTYPYFSTKFVVGTFCSCIVKWEHTRQCASDLDLFCFKHIPPSIEPALGSGLFRNFHAVDEPLSACPREWRWTLWWVFCWDCHSEVCSLIGHPVHALICWGMSVLPGNRNNAEELIFWGWDHERNLRAEVLA